MSVVNITMPKLGESVTEGTINEWLVKVGDYVNKYDPIAEVMTDKVNAEVPSAYSGVVTEIVVAEGDTVSVGEPICTMTLENESEVTEPLAKETDNKQASKTTSDTSERNMRARYSPAVVRLAQEHKIDLNVIDGTGLGGRITRKDVETYIEQNKQQVAELPTTNRVEKVKQDTATPLTGVRKLIADKMVRSKQEIPHAWLTVEVDVTDLVTYREKIKHDFKAQNGYPITYFAFFIYAVARALREFPELNSTFENEALIRHSDVHISIAVAKENELFVPVIRNADERSVSGIAKEIDRLAKKTRTDGLELKDMQGGTFTINNTGTFGSVSSMGIINYPQVAILQVESIVKRPVIIDNMFAARDIVNLCLSLDHRVLDGLICGRFLARVKQILESINEDSTVI